MTPAPPPPPNHYHNCYALKKGSTNYGYEINFLCSSFDKIQTGFKMLKIGFLLHVPDDRSPKADA